MTAGSGIVAAADSFVCSLLAVVYFVFSDGVRNHDIAAAAATRKKRRKKKTSGGKNSLLNTACCCCLSDAALLLNSPQQLRTHFFLLQICGKTN